MSTKIAVLDNGFVRLVDHMGDDLSIVRAARVSFDADWRVGADDKSDERLIRYLMKNRHTSPFEAVQFTFEIKCPIFIARQWHRHRTWSYNEISARYVELDEVRELGDDELKTLTFYDTDENDAPVGRRRSFRTELQRRIDAGLKEAELFACSEF